MGRLIPSYELPNGELLESICYRVYEKYKFTMNNPMNRLNMKSDINYDVLRLIMTGEWVTLTITSDRRFIKFIEVDVLPIDDMPNDIKIVQVWEYEEDIYGEDSRSPDQGHLASTRRTTY